MAANNESVAFGYAQAQDIAEQTEGFRAQVDSDELIALLGELSFELMTAESMQKMFDDLLRENRIQDQFYVTLVDRSSKHTEVWQNYDDIYRARLRAVNEVIPSQDFSNYMASYGASDSDEQITSPDDIPRDTPSLGKVKVKLTHLLCDDKIMLFSLHLLPHEAGYPKKDPPPHLKQYCYMTIGTANATISSKEAVELLDRWRKSGKSATDISALEIDAIFEGDIRPVLRATPTAPAGTYSRLISTCISLTDLEVTVPLPEESHQESHQLTDRIDGTSLLGSMLGCLGCCVHARKVRKVEYTGKVRDCS